MFGSLKAVMLGSFKKAVARLLGNNRPTRSIVVPRRTRLEAEQLGDRIVPTPVVTAAWLADGTEGGANGAVRFSRTGDTSSGLTVTIALGGTAGAGTDYTVGSLSVSFDAGSATADRTVTVTDDLTTEPDETVVVSVSPWGGYGPEYTVGTPSSATVVIRDDDTPVVSVSKIDDAAEGGGNGKFRFTRTADTTNSLTVTYTVSGTATAGTDYTALGGTVTFAAGSATADVTVVVTNDTLSEFAEGVYVILSSGTGYAVGSPAAALVTIVDNETPVVSVSRMFDATEGVYSGFFSLARTGDTTNALTVNVSVGGTATSGTDYTAIGTQVTFAAGSDAALLEVVSKTDAIYDPNETVVATLGTGPGYVVGTPTAATVTIEDAIPLVAVEKVIDATEDGTDGYFRFTRTGDLSSSLTINYTVGGTATSGTDFTALSGSVTFAAGASEVFVPLVPINDALADPGEVVTVTISTGTGHIVDTASATAMIVDDESPVVTLTKVVDAAEGGSTGVFRFDRTGDPTNSLTVNYTLSGTAVGGTDFTALSGTVTFAASSRSTLVNVVPTNDTATEGTETIIAAVTSGSNYGAHPNATALMILSDNDGTNGRIGGVMWNDANGNGIRDLGESLLAGHGVGLLDQWGALLLDAVTDANGVYEFIGLAEGTYYTKVYPPFLYWNTGKDQGADEATDSDIDPTTGQSGPITLTTQNLANLLVGAGFILTTAPAQPPVGTILVKFTRPDGSVLATNGHLKVAKWSDAFQVNPDDAARPIGEQRPMIRGPVNGFDFIDRDQDRFNVRVFDLASWNNNVQYLTVKVSTTNVAGYAAYNDDPTDISLVRINPDKDPTGQWRGWYWSESQMLVSNEVDDKYGDPDAPYVQKDEAAPSATRKHANGQYTSDRTHRIALGGTVTATYTVGGNPVSQTAIVPVVKVVKVHVTNMKHLTGNDGDPAVADAVLDADIRTARETYAQVGIRVDLVDQYQKKDPPANLDLSDGLDVNFSRSGRTGDAILTSEEKLLLPEFRTATQTDIEVYYVRALWVNQPNVRRYRQLGQSYPAVAMKDPGIAGWASSIAIDGEFNTLKQGGGGPWLLAHEMMHVLTNDIFHYGKEREADPNKDQEKPTAHERTNVLVANNKALRTGTVIDSRRLTLAQELKIYTTLLGLLHDPT